MPHDNIDTLRRYSLHARDTTPLGSPSFVMSTMLEGTITGVPSRKDICTMCGSGICPAIERESLMPQRSYGVQGCRSLSRVDA